MQTRDVRSYSIIPVNHSSVNIIIALMKWALLRLIAAKQLKRAAVIIQPKPVMMSNAAFRIACHAADNIQKNL